MKTVLGHVAFVLLVSVMIWTAAGCSGGDDPAQHEYRGIYVDLIWTEPLRVIPGALVELHLHEEYDLPPGTALPAEQMPVHWIVSAGELYEWPSEYIGIPPWDVLQAQEGGQELEIYTFKPVLWLAPPTVQEVQVTGCRNGDALTVTISVVHPDA